MTTQKLFDELALVQKRARTRTMSEPVVAGLAGQVSLFLADAPTGTVVRLGLWDRVANSYKGVPVGTYVCGAKTEDGILVSVRRDSRGFGARHANVELPHGYKLHGAGVHASSGACDSLAKAEIVKCEI